MSHLTRRHAIAGLTAGALSLSFVRGGRAADHNRRRAPDVLIRNGVVVNATGSERKDVLIRDGKIAAVAAGLKPSSRQTNVIDAAGMQLTPGGIDPHVHLVVRESSEEAGGDPSARFVDDMENGSKAALAGGVTTAGVMSFVKEGEAVDAMLARHAKDIEQRASVDVVLHAALNAFTTPGVAGLSTVIAAGQTTFKLFTLMEDFDAKYSNYVELLREARRLRLLPLFHCEDSTVIREATRALKERNQGDLAHYEESRPVLSEELAVEKVLALCELTGCPVYIVHLSSARALAACEAAQRRGLPVFVETRPIYLHLDSTRYKSADGPLYVSFPPIRTPADAQALWHGLEQGTVHTVGSDHAPLLRQQKFDPRHGLDDPLPGMSNLQEMLPMLYAEGVLKGRLSAERFVQVTSTNAARLFSLYPQKGAIAVGSDADIAIWDPALSRPWRAADGYSRSDFSLYEGRTAAAPRMTLRQGEVAYREGKITARAATGRVVRRQPLFDRSLG